MRLLEIQDEMHRLVDDAEREIEAIKRTMAVNRALPDGASRPPARQIAPASVATPLQQRLKRLAAD